MGREDSDMTLDMFSILMGVGRLENVHATHLEWNGHITSVYKFYFNRTCFVVWATPDSAQTYSWLCVL